LRLYAWAQFFFFHSAPAPDPAAKLETRLGPRHNSYLQPTQLAFSGLVAIASRRHDVPNATSDGLSATSNPNDGDGSACDDAGGS
jgi:hypothetical protein